MKLELKFSDFRIENKAKDDQGRLSIAGWAARFGNVDSYGDVIQQGAFAKTIQERADRIAFCWQHDIYQPIGKITLLEERTEGLWVEVLLSASEDDIATKVSEGIVKEMSIGYSTINSVWTQVDGNDIRNLTEVKLYEISLVTIAANADATVEMVKSEEEKTSLIDSEFERIIAITKNESQKYDLLKLHTTIKSLLKHKPTEKPLEEIKEPTVVESLTKDEILSILLN